MLNESGSIFVQISDENAHRVRAILDEVFGASNFVSMITFRTKIPLRNVTLANVSDYIVWYAKNIDTMKYNKLFEGSDEPDLESYNYCLYNSGVIDSPGIQDLGEGNVFTSLDLSSSGSTPSCIFQFSTQGRDFWPTAGKSWKTNREGMTRLEQAERLYAAGKALRYTLFYADYPVAEKTNLWTDTLGEGGKIFIVKTPVKAIERCLLMTTDPGDLVLDPTCGSGTTAFVAEQWGRRWITIDTSRVALSIARQRLMTARFENYKVKKPSGGTAENPGSGFNYKTVPHITIKSIAQNHNLDPIFAKHEPILEIALKSCNAALAKIGAETKRKLEAKLTAKQRAEGKRALTDADERRWKLLGKWEHWEVPFDTDPDWPEGLVKAVTEYRKAWRSKMDEVNACIAANAESEELVDQPETSAGVRVSGPFTVEGVLPAEYSRAESVQLEIAADAAKSASSIPGIYKDEGSPLYAATTDEDSFEEDAGRNAEAYYDQMLRLLKIDGVTFKGNKVKKFGKLSPLWNEGFDQVWQAEGWWEGEDESAPASVALLFGPQYGPLTAMLLEEAMQKAPRAGYTEIVAAAFSFEPEASEIVTDESSHSKLRIHQAFIRPDINPGMEGLLKDQPRSQLFTVFGKPEISLTRGKEGEWTVALEGVDIYDPLTGDVHSTGAGKVAAWFLDSDYDGRAFCITQAFFPDQDAWEKIRKALKTEAEDYAFEAYKGTVSVAFKTGKYAKIAVKVIDPRGNEVMVVKKLEGK
jgi:adenine-specific DNA-methyltransferase